MNAPDPWPEFSEVFADGLAAVPLTADQLQAMADEYQREAIASAQSEADEAARQQEFKR